MDWKTSKVIGTKAFGNKKGVLPASENIEDTKFNHYALQLSLYRYLLEQNYGLNICSHYIVHLQDEECHGIITDYKKNEIIAMIQTLK